MTRPFHLCLILLALLFPALPAPAETEGAPSLVVWLDDGDRDSVPVISPVARGVSAALIRGLKQHGIAARPLGELAPGGRRPVRMAEEQAILLALTGAAPTTGTMLAAAVYTSVEQGEETSAARVKIALRLISFRDGRVLGKGEVVRQGELPATCPRDCLLDGIGKLAAEGAIEATDWAAGRLLPGAE